MPAEWEAHEATWLGWPHKLSDWPGRFAPIPWAFGEIVRKLAPAETGRLLFPSNAHETRGRRVREAAGGGSGEVEVFAVARDRGWTARVGPRRQLPAASNG